MPPQAGQRSGLFITGVRHVHAGSVAPGLPGALQRMIGPRQQAVQGVFVLQGGEAEADGDQQLFTTAEIALLFDVLTNFLRDFQTGLSVGVLEQDDKGFGAPATDDVRMPQALSQAAGEPGQQLIGGDMTVSGVQPLEVVQFHQQRRQGSGLALGFVQGLHGQQVEATAVRQFGQAVEGGLGVDALLVVVDQPTKNGQDRQRHEQADQQVHAQRLENVIAYRGMGGVVARQ